MLLIIPCVATPALPGSKAALLMSIPVSGVIPVALLWAKYMAFSCAIRYQLVGGIESFFERSPIGKSAAALVVISAATVREMPKGEWRAHLPLQMSSCCRLMDPHCRQMGRALSATDKIIHLCKPSSRFLARSHCL